MFTGKLKVTSLLSTLMLTLATVGLAWAPSVGAENCQGPNPPSSCPNNVALGKTVAGNGLFFIGGFGALQTVDLGSIVDGVFLEPGQNWTAGAVWWREDVDSIKNKLTIYLGGTFKVRKLIIQTDNNDDYKVSWNDAISGMTSITVSPTFIPFPGGLAVPVEIPIDAVTDHFIIEHIGVGRGDGYYSVSEFQAIGRKYKLR
jgi:hypothetical protein